MKAKRFAIVLIAIFSSVVLLSFVSPKDNPTWVIPAKYKTMKNTFKDDNSLVKVGKTIYSKHCRKCHGNKGLGDGPKAKSLKTKMLELNDASVKARTDGELYYMSIIGRDEMPNYEKKIIDDEDRWAVIMYIKSLQ